MGTRSLTQFIEDDVVICTLYRQFDGYPFGHGQELYNFLKDFKVVNGFSSDDRDIKCANGMGCLAAQTIAHFKDEIGQFYMVFGEDHGEDYIYQIKVVPIESDNVIHKDGTISNKNSIWGPYKILIKVINGYNNEVLLDWSDLEKFKVFCGG